jgi:hypothetical protein
MDPRIHFALVCASRSCPPIDVYTAGNLDEELFVSGRTFLNAGGLRLDRPARKVHLSRVFQWYKDDFAPNQAERLRYLADFMYREEDRDYLKENADVLKVEYMTYDWRLNRD